ncbi:MAG: hypothetical protein HWE27_18705 [Gammaproteobacteria bacterium]|nr:hypothetical protein [Gammaproteobacteria bacterium]
MKFFRFSLVVVLLTYFSFASSHNTNVTHPLITKLANDSVKNSDSKAGYRELYWWNFDRPFKNRRRNYPYFNGSHINFPPLTRREANEDSDNSYPLFTGIPRDITGGVVAEDIAGNMIAQRVYSHFYHGYTGDDMGFVYWLGTDSRTRSMKFFAESLALYGYIDDLSQNTGGREWREELPEQTVELTYDKHLAYYIFGFSLHHLEDMMSIGHVINDKHFDGQDHSLDDFEGVYIPNIIWRTQTDMVLQAKWRNVFSACSDCVSINSIDDIWPLPISTGEPSFFDQSTKGLARKVYNAAIFQAEFPSPTNSWNLYWTPDGGPSGELIDMFGFASQPLENGESLWFKSYNFPGSSPEYILTYSTVGINGYHIDQPTTGLELDVEGVLGDIWAVEKTGGPKGYYYIEELIPKGIGETDEIIPCKFLLTPPNGIRRNLFIPYNPAENPLVKEVGRECQLKSFVEKFAEEIFPLGISYAAGFKKWWYEIANTPPFLKRVLVKQNSSIVEEKQVKIYDAFWHSISQQGQYNEENWLNGGNSQGLWNELPFQFVSERKLKQNEDVHRSFINSNEPIEIILEFNEPIKLTKSNNNQYDPDSGFKIGLQQVFEDGLGEDIWFDNLENIEIEMQTKNADDIQLHVEDIERIWKLTFPANFWENYDSIKKGGTFRLIVVARDKDKHWEHRTDENSEVGTLDVHPNTPAKRNVIRNDGQGIQITSQFISWHSKESQPDQRLFPNTESGSFAYDMRNMENPNLIGDRNHILIFSNKAKEGLLDDVDPNEPGDIISTTLEPKENDN